MVWVATAVAVVGIGVSVAASSAQSKAAGKAAGEAANANTYEGQLQNSLKQQDAEQSRQSAKDQADKILESARYLRGSQTAQSAASNVLVGEGSAGIMQDRTNELAMSDALAALYSGASGASSNTIAGRFAQKSADMKAASTMSANDANQTAIKYNTAATVLSQAGSIAVRTTTPKPTTTPSGA